MILLDSDVMVDLLRRYPPAVAWFESLDAAERVVLSGYGVMELIQGCRNKPEQERLLRVLKRYGIVWLSPDDCSQALDLFVQYHLSCNAGLLDVLIGQTALMMDVPLYTFNHKHYRFIPGVRMVQPYEKVV